MREGKLYINHLEAYATYGVFLANDRGGTYDNLSALMTPPPVKKYTTVDYRERDGEEVDVTLPRYEARDVSLRFAMVAESELDFRTRYKAFVDVLRSGTLNVRVTETGKTYRLYYQSCPGMVMRTRLRTTGRLAAMWTVKFREPKPEF